MTVFRSPFPDVEIPDLDVTRYVFERAGHHADRVALVDGPSGRSYTYEQLTSAIGCAAGGLADRGIQSGAVLGVMAPNLPEYAIIFHATATAGGAVTTINPLYGAAEVRHQLVDADAQLLVTVPPFVETARDAMEGTNVREIVVIGDAEGTTPFNALLGAPRDHPAIAPTDLAALPYSSGTTGLPKGVMLTHGNLVANLAQIEDHFDIGDDEVYIACLPFFHIYGMQVIMNDGLRRGATLVTMPRFDLEQFLSLTQEHRATRLWVVPPIVLALAKHPIVDQYDLSSVRSVLSGAAPLGPELAAESAARIGAPIAQGYGMTELSPVSHAAPFENAQPGSVGVLVANAEARVVDPEDGRDLGVDEDGEIWIRGPLVMAGYLNNPEATAATIDADGWLHTGDIGHVDADGNWFIVDRVKELIKVKGFQVAPAELEALLITHPAVADVAVIAVPDVECGEIPKAFVVVAPGAEVSVEEIQAHVAGHVATYKRIQAVEFIEAIPKSPSGKILRRLLKDR
jgi:acyl-CoA synthetase (AMP-forming)/AMP-acid ligase II